MVNIASILVSVICTVLIQPSHSKHGIQISSLHSPSSFAIQHGDFDNFLQDMTICTHKLPCFNDGLDLVLIADQSGSVKNEHFEIMRKFLSTFVQHLCHKIGKKLHVRFIAYGNDIRHSSNHTNCQTFLSLISTIQYHHDIYENTFTDKALKKAKKYLHEDRRPKAKNHVILLTDGVSKNHMATVKAADELRDAGNHLIVVGIGPRINEENLHDYVKDSDDVITIKTFKELNTSKTADKILNDLGCKKFRDPVIKPNDTTILMCNQSTTDISKIINYTVIEGHSSCTNTALMNFNQITSLETGDCSIKLNRTLYFADSCGNQANPVEQTITIIDSFKHKLNQYKFPTNKSFTKWPELIESLQECPARITCKETEELHRPNMTNKTTLFLDGSTATVQTIWTLTLCDGSSQKQIRKLSIPVKNDPVGSCEAHNLEVRHESVIGDQSLLVKNDTHDKCNPFEYNVCKNGSYHFQFNITGLPTQNDLQHLCRKMEETVDFCSEVKNIKYFCKLTNETIPGNLTMDGTNQASIGIHCIVHDNSSVDKETVRTGFSYGSHIFYAENDIRINYNNCSEPNDSNQERKPHTSSVSVVDIVVPILLALALIAAVILLLIRRRSRARIMRMKDGVMYARYNNTNYGKQSVAGSVAGLPVNGNLGEVNIGSQPTNTFDNPTYSSTS